MSDVRDLLNEAMAQRESEIGMTRADVAREIGVHKAQVSRLLNGTGNMTFESFSRMAFALRKKPKILLDDMDDLVGNHKLSDDNIMNVKSGGVSPGKFYTEIKLIEPDVA